MEFIIFGRTKECDLSVSISSTIIGNGGKEKVGKENWNQVARGNRGFVGKGMV
jgi:hypothetical protein